MAKKKTYKGERDRHTLRLPVDFSAAVRAKARAAGMSLNDYIGTQLAGVVGVPYDPQEGLQLSA
ncbi:hypothetical protein [Saccharothrix obliqua]|uniref:hypothetical protein n=1 Tax=Saccharothrix obliqua TaxID=2861747 RepID=UPI001C5D35F0|nr:hypothetical protein [Saccharothrix obliqua]MBW4722410.1 hypothetical protein [Saccharothrix obliqua]